ncbi:hypothetical protein [Alkalihalophilus marmarensis]|uniref:hypothetical protein n=1 Tax=Alkalihalophilus marmarensis TaxID=521377 RepID=UPI002E23C901|nr:hypothetical protein [Alkalihalophilus marmarensis]
MSKKVVGAIISLVFLAVGGYYFYQNISGNTDVMMEYLEETQSITDGYLMLLIEEQSIEDEEELEQFTMNNVIPTMDTLTHEAKEIEATIDREELNEVHALLIESFESLIEANQLWLEGSSEADELFMQSDELYLQYEEELENLASKWGVEISWEEME